MKQSPPLFVYIITLLCVVLVSCAGLNPSSDDSPGNPRSNVSSENSDGQSGQEEKPLVLDRTIPVYSSIKDPGDVDIPGTPVMTTRAVVAAIRSAVPGDRLLVVRRGIPLILFDDFDNDGRTDAAYLTVSAGAENSLSLLSDLSRVFDPDVEPFKCRLNVVLQKEFYLLNVIETDLGEDKGLTGFYSVPLDLRGNVAVCIELRIQQGTRTLWFAPSVARESVFESFQTIDRKTIPGDPDGDGDLDIIVTDRLVEEGTGYETFVTLYSWSGRSFRQQDSMGIIRTLHAFFETVRTYLIQGSYGDFNERCIRPETLLTLRRSGFSDREIIGKVFSVPGEGSFTLDKGDEIINIVFPEFQESPFSLTDEILERTFAARLISLKQGSMKIEMKIRMADFPFASLPFYFLPE